MSALLTFPSQYSLEQARASTPGFMRPSEVPFAVSLEGALSPQECIDLIDVLSNADPIPYSVKGCGAATREIVAAPVLDPIERIARNINARYFGYDLDEGQYSWMQTYQEGGQYQRHMDGSPGQTRKLTAVALLSSPLDYEGGRLTLHVLPKSFVVPRTRGTVVVFQHWVEHDVSPISFGSRQTINMGFWGPAFR